MKELEKGGVRGSKGRRKRNKGRKKCCGKCMLHGKGIERVG